MAGVGRRQVEFEEHVADMLVDDAFGHHQALSDLGVPESRRRQPGVPHTWVVISVAMARKLRQAGVRWDPRPGDRFVVDQPEMAEQVFWVSDFTVDLHEFADERVLAFNGTTEWALDSVLVADCVWLPREDQLRRLLGSMLVRLERQDDIWTVICRVGGTETATADADVEQAYARALLGALG